MTEKEKAYDEAVERAKKIYGNSIAEEIFPELKESEDERIKKAIIEFFESEDDNTTYSLVRKKDIIAWLEKQGEQKPTLPKWKYKKDNTPLLRDSIILNKYGGVAKSPSGAIVSDAWVLDYDELAKLPKEENIEPKFKVGDWIITPTNKVLQITSIEGTSYRFNNKSHYWAICYCDEQCRLWTIQDAKDGDVIEFEDHGRLVTGIVSFVNKTTGKVDVSCLLEGNKFKIGVFYNLDTVKPHPATKEQRDALMKAMNDAGYEWDGEKKELKKLKNSKFDPKTLQPFDKVLVRDDRILDLWRCTFFSHIKDKGFWEYATADSAYAYCIPYNDDTKHLVGTTKEAPEYYRYWEE